MEVVRPLFNADLVASVIHSVSAIFLLNLSHARTTKSVKLDNAYRVDPLPFAANAALWSAFMHQACMYIFMKNGAFVRINGFNYTRWLDYFVSASLMVVPIGIFAGNLSLAVLCVSAAAMSMLMALAGVSEFFLLRVDTSEKSYRIRKAVQIVQPAAGIGIIACSAFQLVFTNDHAEKEFLLRTGVMGMLFGVPHIVVSFYAMSDQIRGWATAVSAAASYIMLWATVFGSATFASNPWPLGIMVLSHSNFGPLFFAAVALKNSSVFDYNNPNFYDGVNTCFSVFSKVVLHWLVFFNSPNSPPPPLTSNNWLQHRALWDNIFVVLLATFSASIVFYFLYSEHYGAKYNNKS